MWHWRFRWALACLLPTLLRIHHEVSRVQWVGLRRNDLGSVLLVAPSTLCGFPTVMQGSAGVSASQVVRCPVIPAGPEPYARICARISMSSPGEPAVMLPLAHPLVGLH